MAIDLQRLGQDLWLLEPVDRADDRTSPADLKLRLRQGVDIGVVSGVENLQQALILRLLTPRGALEPLGHPSYGSRLHTLIGEPNTERNRNRAKLFVLEALAQEPRLGEVLSISVTTDRRRSPTRIDVTLSAKVTETGEVLNLVFPFFLEVAS
jgi:phage baseplate assembly protein W